VYRGKPSYQPGSHPVSWPWLSSDSRYFGIATWAPVSPPVVVVFEKSRLGWSCESVTTMTPAMVITVMAPGTHHQLVREDAGATGAGSVDGLS
jgi:hypothetical protein